MFEKSLKDIVSGIRASKRDTALYLSQCLAEIKNELQSSDVQIKANALTKLTFLQMMGYSMSVASFPTIEVMSSPRFAHKRVGYLAACQGFRQDTDVLLLTTNLLKKELRVAAGTQAVYATGLAINCVANIVTEELARDLLPEITNLTQHPSPYLRKKAVLALYKLFVKYPQGLRLAFDRLKKCLKDPDSAVVSCAVNVITELADKNPTNYLHLAPDFFDLLKADNNWMCIKVVKLLGTLVAVEPRLARKLLEPLAAIVKETEAKSLQFESVHTITLCLPYTRKSDGSQPAVVPEIVDLCAATLRDLVDMKDQNLKYLGLVGFGSLVQSHPKVLSSAEYRPLILACLSDPDETIRTRALELLTVMVTRKNLRDVVDQLVPAHVTGGTGSFSSSPTYRSTLVSQVVQMCAADKYSRIVSFEWYFGVLLKLGSVKGLTGVDGVLHSQIQNVALRVLPVRGRAVELCVEALHEQHLEKEKPFFMSEILPAVAWIVGEYADEMKGDYHRTIEALTIPSHNQEVPPNTLKVYVQAAMKIFAAASADPSIASSELEQCLRTLCTGLGVFAQSPNPEVMERAFMGLQLLEGLNLAPNGAPGLEMIIDEASEDGDLLGMGAEAPASTKSSVVNESMARKIREASTDLNSVLKPSPMKPIGTKAQRKKRETGPMTSNDTIKWDVFSSIIAEETADRNRTNRSLDVVCFTQQTPMKVEESLPPASSTNLFCGGAAGTGPTIGASTAEQSRVKESDPFYLHNTPSTDSQEDVVPSNAPGAILVLGSDEEEDHHSERRKRKKSKKKSKRSKGSHSLGSGNMVYESDDDEEGVSGVVSNSTRRGRGKEFAGLASVDLTVPLQEGEVMPQRQHRVVQSQAAVGPTVGLVETQKPKKQKKRKKDKRSERSKDNVVGDLLDLSALNVAPSSVQPPINTALVEATTVALESIHAGVNPINTAFDDLIGLSSESKPMTSLQPTAASAFMPIPDTSMAEVRRSPKKAKSKRPLMKATVKTSGKSRASIDPSLLTVNYRVNCKESEQFIQLVVFNGSATIISNVSLEIRGCAPELMGAIKAGSTAKSGKIGPLPILNTEDSQDVKCKMVTPLGIFSLKLVLPVPLIPETDKTIDDVAGEMGSGLWHSASAKLAATGRNDLKESICAFLDAAEVEDSNATSSMGTLACRSRQGSAVRVLVKIKTGNAKIDVRSTSQSLAKAIAADMKRLIFR